MENLKIKVGSESESTEAQELFFKLGYTWHYNRKPTIENVKGTIKATDDGTMVSGDIFSTNHKEITIQELKDMVVLKRKDPKDANYIDEKDNLFYKSLGCENLYRWFCGSHWADAVSYSGMLKPIQNKSIIDKLVDLPEFKHDIVNHPDHYTNGNIECIDAIQASMSIEAFAGFLKGNMIKYMWRYEHKNGIEDLKKAQWYQNKLIELLG